MDTRVYENISLASRELSLLQAEIQDGKFGKSGEPFMTTRALSKLRSISVVTAHNVLVGLCESGHLELRGKRYYLTYDKVAASSKAREKKLIGLLIPKLNNEFFASLADAVIMLAKKQGYQVLILSVDYSPNEEIRALHTLSDLPISGIISCLQTSLENEHFYHNSTVPSVMLAHSLSSGKISSVQVNSFSISQKVAQHLLDEGYRHFLYIGNNNRSLENDQRFTGFQMILNRQGFYLDDSHILQVTVDSENDSALIRQRLEQQSEPIGVYCYHDLIAAQLYRICNQIGKRIPEDVGVVGFDDLSVATLIVPALTTVQYRIETMADMALKLLLSRIENPNTPYDNYYIEPNLCIRKSSTLSSGKRNK